LSHAERLSAQIIKNIAHCTIVEGTKGQFDVFRNGRLIYSKEHSGKFPELADIGYGENEIYK